MKFINIFFALAVCCTVTVYAQENYRLEGHIAGDVEGKTVYLLKGNDERNRTVVDSTIIKAGDFTFEGKLALPGPFAVKIFMTGDRSFFSKEMKHIGRPHLPLFLSNGSVRVEAHVNDLPLTALKTNGYDYSKIRITGSDESTAFIQYIKDKALLMIKRDSLNTQYKAYLNKRPHASVTEGLNIVEKIDAIDSQVKRIIKVFIMNNLDKMAAVYAFRETNLSSNTGVFSYNEVNEFLASFSANIQSTSYYNLVASEANEINKYAIGRQFTDLDLFDATYNKVSLSDYVGKGKYVLIDFWGPQCIPCRKEFPFIKETYAIYHSHGLEIIGISVDKDKQRWPKAMAEENLPWKQFAFVNDPMTTNHSVRKYAYLSIPFSILIGPDGKIIDRNMMGSYMDRKLIEIYGDKFRTN